MPKIKIGEKIKLVPAIFDVTQGRSQKPKAYEATIIYINKPHRFFRARFDFPNGSSFAESFKFITPEDRGIRAI